ncbi:MAG TPA: hypothetical protein VL240_02335 [Candidatus Binatia bacterium]|nr:hypothetical protein [Candidatus Binatia bacterium]
MATQPKTPNPATPESTAPSGAPQAAAAAPAREAPAATAAGAAQPTAVTAPATGYSGSDKGGNHAVEVVGRKPQRWNITLHLVNGYAKPQGDWRTEMRVGDSVHFVSPDGEVRVEFESLPGVDAKTGKPVPAGPTPFGQNPLDIQGGKTGERTFLVVNSCKAVMRCYIIQPDGTEIGYAEEGADKNPGTTVCTGGGSSPVKC